MQYPFACVPYLTSERVKKAKPVATLQELPLTCPWLAPAKFSGSTPMGLQEWENWRQRTTSCKLRAGKGNHNGAGEQSQICWRRSQAHSLLLSPAAYCQSPWPGRPVKFPWPGQSSIETLSLGGRP